jgi:hypothetical protein
MEEWLMSDGTISDFFISDFPYYHKRFPFLTFHISTLSHLRIFLKHFTKVYKKTVRAILTKTIINTKIGAGKFI